MFSANITNRDPAEILLKNTADREFPLWPTIVLRRSPGARSRGGRVAGCWRWRTCSLGGRRHGPAASSCHRSAQQHSQCAVSSLRDGVRRRRAQPEGVLLLLRPIGGRLLLGPLLPLPPPPPPPLVWAIGRYPTGVARMQLRINITLAKRSSRMRPGA
eukprot:COSAG01_NODE_13721_length_1544_cov_1.624221_2_plen_158_part_01